MNSGLPRNRKMNHSAGFLAQGRIQGHGAQQPLQVVGGDLRGVGAAAVQDGLHRGRFAPFNAAGKLLVKDQDEQGPLLLHDRADVRLSFQKAHTAEGGRALNAADDFPAPAAVVLVQHGHVHIAHFQGGGPAKGHDLQQGRHNDQGAGNPVAKQHQQFLAHNGEHAPPVEPGKGKDGHLTRPGA